MLSMRCKHVFYKPLHYAKRKSHGIEFEYLEIQKRNILMDRARRVDKKNGVICLAVIFTPTVSH